MIQKVQFRGVFTIADLPDHVDLDIVSRCFDAGLQMEDLPWRLPNLQRIENVVMDSYRLKAVEAVYHQIDRLVITTQTTQPSSAETEYTGTKYTTVATDIYYRSGISNPYRIGFQVRDPAANGSWGSFVLIDSNGVMINRALANTSKTAGAAKIVDFQGTVS